jgi:hypothetical protein
VLLIHSRVHFVLSVPFCLWRTYPVRPINNYHSFLPRMTFLQPRAVVGVSFRDCFTFSASWFQRFRPRIIPCVRRVNIR